MSLPSVQSPRFHRGLRFDVRVVGATYDITLSNDNEQEAALYFSLDVREHGDRLDVLVNVEGLPIGTTAGIHNILWKIVAEVPGEGIDVEFIVPHVPGTGRGHLERAIQYGMAREVDHYWPSFEKNPAIKCKIFEGATSDTTH